MQQCQFSALLGRLTPTHLFTGVDLNASTYIPGSKLGADARRRYLGYSNTVQSNFGWDAGYQSLQATMQQVDP